MDSNFQVKITADLSQLEKSLGNVKTLLGNVGTTAQSSANVIKESTDKASASVGNLNKTFQQTNDNSGRARLAAFAFGQVIRDAGFFSQSFGLGLLAISNNIPILIDQLVLLTGISGAAGVAISLIGSALTAGLTAFAYYAQSLARDGKSVTGVFKEMALDSESALGSLVNYLSSPPASTILNQMIGSVQSGFSEMKALFRDFVSLAISVWDKFGTDIMNATGTMFSYLTETLKFQLGLSLNILKAFSALMQGDFSGVANAIGNIFKGLANQIINWLTFVASRGTQIIGSFVGLFDKLAGENIKNAGAQLKQFGDSLKFTSKESQSADFNLKKWIQSLDGSVKKTKEAEKSTNALSDIYKRLNAELTAIDLDPTLTELEKVKGKTNAYQAALKSLIEAGYKPGSEAVKNIVAELTKLDATYDGLISKQEGLKKQTDFLAELDKVAKSLESKRIDIYSGVDVSKSKQIKQEIEATSDALNKFRALAAQNPSLAQFTGLNTVIGLLSQNLKTLGVDFDNAIRTEDAAKKLEDFTNKVTEIFNSGIVSGVSATMQGIGEAIASGGNIANAAGAALLGSLGAILTQLGELAIATGVAISGIKKALQSLNPVVAIAAGVALLALAGFVKGKAKSIGGGGGGGSSESAPSGDFGSVRPFASGGIISGPTNALMGEYPGAKSNPEVVAPLDKLQGILGNTIGGSQQVGALETRISGNDLVILMERATKNRKNYF
jgi:hypothetical protein